MIRRLSTALAGTALAAATLSWAAPAPSELIGAVQSPQQWVGLHGADQAVLVVAAGVGWLVLGWLTLGVAVLTATELPGALGGLARLLAAVVLPAALRQGLTLALGIGLVTSSAGLAAAEPPFTPASPSTPGASIDWPAQPPTRSDPPPTGPPATGPPTVGDPIGGVVVQSGDSLWVIAEDRLAPGASDATIWSAVGEWYAVNRAVIGPDPDLIQPGQRLSPPGTSS